MKIREVKTAEDIRIFLEMPLRIYKGDPLYIRPLDQDIERVFDRKKNKYFRHGDAIRWILLNEKGECIGRVAAFVNERTAKTFEQPTGGMGFFECIHDQHAANLLFDSCKTWLKEKGMEAMDGPINFGDRDAWWGLLAEGFASPTYQMNYNPSWYTALFTNYGFGIYYKQFVLYRHVQEPVQERFIEKYNKVMAEPGYSFIHIRKKELEKFGKDFREIYNLAWGKHFGFKAMTEAQAQSIMKTMKPILAEELMWFGYHNEKPVAFFIMIPDLNQIFKNFGGKFGLWQKLRTWWTLKFGKLTNCYGVLFGVVPEYQGKGLDGAIVTASSLVLHPQKKWGDMEMNWIGDFNPKMLNVALAVGGEIKKTYYTMRKLFDETKEFKRAPII